MRRRIAAMLSGLALLVLAAPVRADPVDEDADLAARDPDYAAGRQSLQAQDWAAAVERLSKAQVRHPDHADLHNDLGFAYRNLKRYDEAFKHYEQALAIDPRHRAAHEYIGEAYLQVGDVKSAERHVAELRRICLLGCEELADLEQAVREHRARGEGAAGRRN